tara:strand:+ start:7169 stop:7609 length:441 start_codon:yes stop_codon:yes gene_type:complete
MSDIQKTYENLPSEYLNITKTYLSVDEGTMDIAIKRHPSVFAFFGSVLSFAKRASDGLNSKLEMKEAKHMELRRAELAEKGVKATQAALTNYILTVQELVDLREEVLESQHRYNLAKNIVTSLDHQKDMLVQMSANKRAEVRLHEL